MNILAACLSLAVFMVLLKALRVDSTAVDAIAISRRATAVLRNPRLSDDVKEKMARRYSLRLLARFFCIAIPTVIAGTASFSLLFLMDWLNVASLEDTLSLMTDWIFIMAILAASVSALGGLAVLRKLRGARHEI